MSERRYFDRLVVRTEKITLHARVSAGSSCCWKCDHTILRVYWKLMLQSASRRTVA